MTRPPRRRATSAGRYSKDLSRHLHVRVSDEEYAGYERAAADMGLTVAEWTRHKLAEALDDSNGAKVCVDKSE